MAQARCARFAGRMVSRVVGSADGLTANQRASQPTSHPRAMDLVPGASKKKTQITDKLSDGIFLDIKEGSEEFFIGTLAGCVVCETVQRRPRVDAAEPVFLFNSNRGTLRRVVPEDEPREPREPLEQPLMTYVLVHADLPPPLSTEPYKPRRVYIRNSVELARHGCTLGCMALKQP